MNLITRRRAKWVGLVLCVLLAVVFVSSMWVAVYVESLTIGSEWWVGVIESGRFGFAGVPDQGNPAVGLGPYFHIGTEYGFKLNLWFDWNLKNLGKGSNLHFVLCPLWMPPLLLAVPTFWLWRTDRRAKPWQCATCRYDLRGLEGGVCPECGEAPQSQ